MKTSFFITLMLLCPILQGQTITRIEPPNWWVGMKDPNLQLMLYGENIGQLQARIHHKGVRLKQFSCPGNHNYLFLTIEIKAGAKAGIIPISLFDHDRQILNVDYSLLDREKGSGDRHGFNTEDVIYLITPDRFANGNPLNDNVDGLTEKMNREDKTGRHGGDIEGMRQHLDYISALGFTAIWPQPVLENNMPTYSYHGYAITDFYKVDPRMGTNESYRDFCQDASQKGIKVIMDMVVNHCGLGHWWMSDPPTNDWINNYAKPYIGTSHRKTIQMDSYAAPEDYDVFNKGWFVPTMPDLNPANPYLGTYLTQNTIWWIEYAGLSGIRMDTYVYPDENYMSEWSKRIMSEYPNFNIAGEAWHTNPAIVSYWQRGKINSNGYVSYLPALFDFPIQYALKNALMSPDEGDSGWAILYETLAQDFQYPDPENLVIFPDNHDMNRIYTQLDQDLAKFKMAITFILTARGIPELFYGTEILKTSPIRRDDGIIRSDFPGGWTGDRINAFSESELNSEQKEAKAFIGKLVRWRKEASVIHHGKLMQFVPEKGIYVFFRYTDTTTIMVVLNKNDEPTTLPLDRFKRMFGHKTSGTEIISGNEVDLREPLRLEAPGPSIIEIKN